MKNPLFSMLCPTLALAEKLSTYYLTAFDLCVQEMNMKQDQQDAGGMQMGGMSL